MDAFMGGVFAGVLSIMCIYIVMDGSTGKTMVQHGCAVYDQHTGKFTFLDELDKGE